MPGWVQGFADHVAHMTIGAIVYPLALLIFNYLLFAFQSALIYRIYHITQAVRIYPQKLIKGVFGYHFVVNGAVTPGAAVAGTAELGDHFTVSTFRHIF